jgi:RsmE family RNA methyltransferase
VENSTDVELLVGPEGGFELSEEEQAIRAGFRPVGLGSHILRTETAAIVAVGVIASWYHRLELKAGSDAPDRENGGGWGSLSH